MGKQLVYFFLFLSGIYSRKSEKDSKIEVLSKSVLHLIENKGDCFNRVIVIPNAGCNGCITFAESFYKKNYKREDLFFVFTNIISLKLLKLKLNINITKQPNVFVDANNIFSQYNGAIYPVSILYNCEDQEINSIKFQEPGNDIFSELL